MYRIDIGRREVQIIQTSVAKGMATSVVPLNNQYFAATSTSEIEFFDALTGMSVNSVQTSQLSPNSTYYGLDTLLTLSVIHQQQDTTKRYLAASGTSKIIYVYKVDLLLKCASMMVTQIITQHQNTIANLSFIRGLDHHYLVSASIDRHQGIYKIQLPAI